VLLGGVLPGTVPCPVECAQGTQAMAGWCQNQG